MLAITRGALLLGVLVAASASWSPARAEETRSTFFQGPSPCSAVEKVEQDRVLLSTPKECAKDTPSMLNVSVPARLSKVRLFNNGQFWKEHTLTVVNQAVVDSAVKKGETTSKDLAAKGVSVAQNKFNKQAAEVAGKSAEIIYSEAMQGQIRAEQERLKVEVFGEQLRGTPVDPAKPTGNAEALGKKFLAEDERVYLFVSSSIPETTLRTYLAALDKTRDPLAVMVLRGFVGGAAKIKPTMDYMQRILAKDPACIASQKQDANCPTFLAEVQIDPLLFQRFNVQKVPTLVFARGVKNVAGLPQVSEGDGENMQVGAWWALEGDAALDHMLERINKEAKSPTLAVFVKELRKGFYQ